MLISLAFSLAGLLGLWLLLRPLPDTRLAAVRQVARVTRLRARPRRVAAAPQQGAGSRQ